MSDSIIERAFTPSAEHQDTSLVVELPLTIHGVEEMYQLKLLREFETNYSLTPQKVQDLWRMASKHKSLFSDYTDGKFEPFFVLLMDPRGVWMEVARENQPVGVMYLTAIKPMFDADCHIAFWDSIGSGREALALYAIEWAMDRYSLHRITAKTSPKQRGAMKFAERLGFQHEGRVREALISQGEWIDMHTYGILRSEVEENLFRVW